MYHIRFGKTRKNGRHPEDVCRILQKLCAERENHDRDQTSQCQGEAGDCAGKLVHLGGLCRTDDMGGGAEGNTLGNGVADFEKLAQVRTGGVTENTGDRDGESGNGSKATQFFADGSAYGGGDALGQKGNQHRLIQPEESGCKVDE